MLNVGWNERRFFLETDFTTTFFSCFEYSHSKRLLNEEEELLELVGAKKRGWVANKQAPYSNTKKYLQQVSLKTESILFYDSKIVGMYVLLLSWN